MPLYVLNQTYFEMMEHGLLFYFQHDELAALSASNESESYFAHSAWIF